MKSWKTTVAGVIVLAFAVYLYSIDKVAEAGVAAATGLGLLASKDSDVTGGTRSV